MIDSGVNPRHPHIEAGIAGGISIASDGFVEEGSFLDRLGHGTAVTAAIQEKAPHAEYYAVRIFHEKLRTSSTSLLRAMEWAVEENMDVVNLSLGTRNDAHEELFRPIVDRAVKAGISVISAFDCYPGLIDGVLGVDLCPDCARDSYGIRGRVFLAAGYPRSAPGISRERNLQGISFAVANFSGFVACALGFVDRSQLRPELIRGARNPT